MRKFTLALAAAAALTANVALAATIDPTYTVNPAAGTASNLQDIVLTFEENVYFTENNRMPIVTLTNETTGTEWVCEQPTRNTTYASETGTQWILTFVDQDSFGYNGEGTTNEDGETVEPEGPYAPETINEPGQYTLTVKGMIANPVYEEVDGENVLESYDDVAAFTVEYTIAYPVEYTLTPEAGETVSSISTIILEFPDTRNVAFYENNRMPIATLTNGLQGDDEVAYYCYEADVNNRAESMGVVYELTFVNEEDELVEVVEEGYWHLTIQGLALTVAQEDGPDEIVGDLPVITATFHIDGSMKVDSLLNNVDLNGAVYNLNGVKVGNSLNGLAKGVYIVNGKKVLVK